MKNRLNVWTAGGLIVAMSLVGCGGKKPPIVSLPPPKPPERVPPKVATPIDQALRTQARAELKSALASNDFFLRANAVEATQRAIGVEGKEDILKALDDKENLVRFAACMATGTLRIAEARGKLLQMADDPTARVQIGARFALHRLGDTRLSQQLADYSRDTKPQTRGDAALAIGLLGEPTGVRVLRKMTTDTSPAVRMQVAEALWRLKSEDGLDYLVGATLSQAADDQILAVMALAYPKDLGVIEHIRGRLTSEYDEISLSAARAMGVLGTDEGYGVALKGAKSIDPRQRALAALAFGEIGRSDAQLFLKKLLTDTDPMVRVSAAQAILQLKPPTDAPDRP